MLRERVFDSCNRNTYICNATFLKMQTELNTIIIPMPQLIINSMQLQSKMQWGFPENMINLTSKFMRTVKDHGSPRLVLPKLFHILAHLSNNNISMAAPGAPGPWGVHGSRSFASSTTPYLHTPLCGT